MTSLVNSNEDNKRHCDKEIDAVSSNVAKFPSLWDIDKSPQIHFDTIICCLDELVLSEYNKRARCRPLDRSSPAESMCDARQIKLLRNLESSPGIPAQRYCHHPKCLD